MLPALIAMYWMNFSEQDSQLDRNVVDTMLCAGETNRDSCQGDSGGET